MWNSLSARRSEPLSHMFILYGAVMLVLTLIVVYFCRCVCVQGLFTGRVGTGDQLGIAGFRAGCILGECLHGNTYPVLCMCVSACSILLLHRPVCIMFDWLHCKDDGIKGALCYVHTL